MIQVFDIETNFWEMHPDFKAAGASKKLYDSDRTKKKDKTSKLMWTIALIWDMNSKYYNMPEYDTEDEQGKISLMFEEVYGDKEYYLKNQEQILYLKMQYIRMQDTPSKRALRDLQDKVDERAIFIKQTKYELGDWNERGTLVGNTSKIIDDMLKASKNIFELLEAAHKAVNEENAATETKGGGNVSLGDSGEI